MDIKNSLIAEINSAVNNLYQVDPYHAVVEKTNKDFRGDYTFVVFPLLKMSKKKPEETATEIGEYLKSNSSIVEGFNIVKGFLNIELTPSSWFHALELPDVPYTSNGVTKVVEYSSPNTNKPLHLGHIRNILLGYSVSMILKEAGFDVAMVNLVNDRGIHICKSMLAWELYGNNETPASSGLKGDHLVGKYYVEFDKAYKKEIAELKAQGLSEEEAEKNAPLIKQAQEMLRKWESGDKHVIGLWRKMNGWVYEGFDKTYQSLGVSFDKTYYESDTYLLGKAIVEEGLSKGVLFKKDDNSVWIDLTSDGLDQKLLLRGDGTSVYITQDIGTATLRFNDYKAESYVYVVGNEQEYHFKVLKLILTRLGYAQGEKIYHLSYGMVELPEGKMKSREGTVVDADDLISEMQSTAESLTRELGKIEDFETSEANELFTTIGMGALKYYILKVDPRKKMLFNPKESIDFNGNTGPFIQYTYARIKSVLRKADSNNASFSGTIELKESEKELLKLIAEYPEVIREAAAGFSPANVANYVYELAKAYNQFYHDITILKEENTELRNFRLKLSEKVASRLKRSMMLLGISVPERM